MATVPLATVLIDTYNYGQFIEQAIESVLSQDFPEEQLEIIVVDDGSTDDTAERLKNTVRGFNTCIKRMAGRRPRSMLDLRMLGAN